MYIYIYIYIFDISISDRISIIYAIISKYLSLESTILLAKPALQLTPSFFFP